MPCAEEVFDDELSTTKQVSSAFDIDYLQLSSLLLPVRQHSVCNSVIVIALMCR